MIRRPIYEPTDGLVIASVKPSHPVFWDAPANQNGLRAPKLKHQLVLKPPSYTGLGAVVLSWILCVLYSVQIGLGPLVAPLSLVTV